MLNSSPSSPVLYCCCLPQRLPRFTTQAPLISVIGGAASLSEAEREELTKQNCIFDDTGDNISSLNSIFGDLTVTYWAWKNTNDEHLGVCQYRRPWNEQCLLRAEDNVLYVPDCAWFSSVEQQYMECHSVFPAPALTRDLARRGRLPLSFEMIDEAWKQSRFYGCNMLRGPRVLFDKYCALMFEAIMPLWEENRQLCESLHGYQRRSIAFAAERITTAIILNADHFFGHQVVQQSQIAFCG